MTQWYEQQSSYESISNDWHSINWKEVNKKRKRLRDVFFAAEKRGDSKSVRKRQGLIVRSKINIFKVFVRLQ